MYESVRIKRQSDTAKKCLICEQVKDKETGYYKGSGKYYMSYCKDCSKLKQKLSYVRKKPERAVSV